MMITNWLSNNYIEAFGALAGIVYVFLEIRQTIWLWPVGIITSAVYIWVFFAGKLYADMSLQGYYLLISILGWYWWLKGSKAQRLKGSTEEEERVGLKVTRLKLITGLILGVVFVFLYSGMWLVLSKFTDSPVPGLDAFITSLSIIATWMLARKIYEHWFLWLVVNLVASILFLTRGLYPTVILYAVYFAMSFIGLKEWRKTMPHPPAEWE
jgi:nicotinamide mononucleotide transporter